LLLVIFTKIAYSQPGPPSGKDRGIYVECADNIVFDMAAGNFTSRDALKQFLLDRQMKYAALFGIDHSNAHPNGVLGDAALENQLSDLIVYLKQNVPGLTIGVVVSEKDYPSTIQYYNWGWFPLPTSCGGPSISQEYVMPIVNPGTSASYSRKKLAMMARSCMNILYYNSGSASSGFGTLAAGIPTGHSGKIDYISIEKEYWQSPDEITLNGPKYFSQAWLNFKTLLDLADKVSSYTCNLIKTEVYLKIVDYTQPTQVAFQSISYPNCAKPGGPSTTWAQVTTPSNFPTGTQQASYIDPRADRILLVDYKTEFSATNWAWVDEHVDAHCGNLTLVGASNPSNSVVWPLFSVEKDGWQIDCNLPLTQSTFLGGYLTDPTGGHLFNVEQKYLTRYGLSNYVCNTCTTYSTFHTQKQKNQIKGFMWFNRKMITDNSTIYKIGNLTSESNSYQYLNIYPNPAKDYVNIKYSLTNENLFSHITITNLEGKIIKSLINNEYEASIEIDITDLPTGIYTVKVIGNLSGLESKNLFIE
jgi:hypothetical protein